MSRSAPAKDGFQALHPSRAFMVDYLHFTRNVPSHPLARDCELSEVNVLRKSSSQRISWAAIFIKAYAVMAKRHPVLRQRICDWPWMRVYQKPRQGAKVCVRREHRGSQWLFFHSVDSPEELTLNEIQNQLDDVKTRPVSDIRPFHLQTIVSRFPTFVRRLCWFVATNFPNLGGLASRGTYGVTSVAAWNAISIHPRSAGHIVLTYAPIQEDGTMRVTMVYDHRLLDGSTIGEFLGELEEVLNTTIVKELRSMNFQREATADHWRIVHQ